MATKARKKLNITPEDRAKRTERILATKRRSYTREQVTEHLNAIEAWLIEGNSTSVIKGYAKEQLGIGATRAITLCKRIHERWDQEDAEARKKWKATQIRRITENMKGMNKHDSRSGYVATEKLLSEIMGTKEVVKVEVEHTAKTSIADFLSGLSEEQLNVFKATGQTAAYMATKAGQVKP